MSSCSCRLTELQSLQNALCVAAPLAGLGVWQDTNGRPGKGVASFAFALVSH